MSGRDDGAFWLYDLKAEIARIFEETAYPIEHVINGGGVPKGRGEN